METAIVNPAVHEAYAREGYIRQDGSKDNGKLVARITEIVVKHKALSKREREEKAISKGALVAEAFPSVIGPDGFDAAPDLDRPLVEAVYKQIATDVWGNVRPAADAHVQRNVAVVMGNGYVLCRTKLGKDNVDAVYITDERECILADFTRPDNEALQRHIERVTRNREMLMIRQPQNAKKYSSEYQKALANVSLLAKNQLQLTMDMLNQPQEEPDSEETAA